MGRANTAQLHCPNRKAEVVQFAAFMATPRSPKQQQALIDEQSALPPECCAAMHPYLLGVRRCSDSATVPAHCVSNKAVYYMKNYACRLLLLLETHTSGRSAHIARSTAIAVMTWIRLLQYTVAERQQGMSGASWARQTPCHALQGCSCDPALVRLWTAVTGESAAQMEYGARMVPMACRFAQADNPCCARNVTLLAPC